MEIVIINKIGYSHYNGIITFDESTGEIVIQAGVYCYLSDQTQINIQETRATIENGERIFITNNGLVLCHNEIDIDGNLYSTTIDPDSYEFFDLFGFMESGIFYYININEEG